MVPVAAPMRPLATLAWGLLLVVLDFRVQGVDLLPDPIGWGLGAVAALSLFRSVGKAQPEARRWFAATCVACTAALLPAVPEWVGVQHPIITVAVAVAQTVVVFATCTGVMSVLPARRATANAVRWSDLGTASLLAVLMGGATVVPELAPLALLTALATLAVLVWFLVLLFQAAKDPAPSY